MKHALVTGASGAIGSAIARTLGRSGLHVHVHAHDHRGRAQAVVDEIRAEGGTAQAVFFDVTDAGDTGAALAGILERAPIQVLVNNAGVHDDAPMAGMSAAQWHHVIAVSLTGFFNVTQPLLLPMIRTRWGRVVSVSSVAAIAGNRGQANYAAAKSGLHGATRSLAIELASRGITVNAVAPGIIASPMADAVFSPEAIAALVPMKRAGTPQEVASLIGFLCSEEAGYISGQIVSINGAMA